VPIVASNSDLAIHLREVRLRQEAIARTADQLVPGEANPLIVAVTIVELSEVALRHLKAVGG
jgi:hypothetical protein